MLRSFLNAAAPQAQYAFRTVTVASCGPQLEPGARELLSPAATLARRMRVPSLALLLAFAGGRGAGLSVTSPREGDILFASGRNQAFMDLSFDLATELRQGCAIHMLLDERRIAYWIPDPMLPAGATGEPNLWEMNSWIETFAKGRPRSISVKMQPGPHRARLTLGA